MTTPASSSPWNPAQYERFKDERTAPFFDLLSLVEPIPGGRAIDLGCGTGELTAVMHERVKAKSTIGLDNSETMLERSASFAGSGLRFKLGTAMRFAPRAPLDLIFSNAALQWLPDHEKLFVRLANGLAKRGQFAVQMPANHDHPTHQTAFELAAEEPWRSALGGYTRTWPVLPPERYAEILDNLGFQQQSVRLQVYGHHLASRDETVEWVKGTLLTPYQERMAPDAYARFLAAYRERLLPHLANTKPYFYAFKRVILWARK